MNNTIRGLSATLLAVALFAANALTVAAEDQSGRTQLYLPSGSNAAIQYIDGADTFFRFANVIPGDILTQNIEIQNRRNETVTFYLHTNDSSEEDGLLQQIGLTITNTSSGQVIYKGNLTGKATSAYSNDMYQNSATQPNGISMGNFSTNATAHIEAVINVPVAINNDYADKISKITWNVRAQIPDPDRSSSRSSSTGGTDEQDTDRDRSYSVITDADIPRDNEPYRIADEQLPIVNLPKTGGGSAPCLGVAAVLLVVSAQSFRKRNTCRRFHSL